MKPSNQELNAKWWHRLTKVAMLAVTIISLIISLCFISLSISSTKKIILSFEGSYKGHQGNELYISEIHQNLYANVILDRIEEVNPKVLPVIPTISDEKKDNSESLPLAVQNFFDNLDKLEKMEREFLSTNPTPREAIKFFWKKESASAEDVLNKVLEYYPGWKMKEWKEYKINWLTFLPTALLSPITYLTLWLLYYKVLLYIIYGK